MKDYKILKNIYPDELQDIVKEHMEKGWEPIGGICVNNTIKTIRYNTEYQTTTYHQAMVLKEQIPPTH